MDPKGAEQRTNIGGVNINNIREGHVNIRDIHANVEAEKDIVGGNKYEPVSPPPEPGPMPQQPKEPPAHRLKRFCEDFFAKVPPQTKLYVKYNQDLYHLECLATRDADLAAGLDVSSDKSPEVRAAKFLEQLVGRYDLFSLDEQVRDFKKQLFTKHVLSSYMGTHCIFALRNGPQEIEDAIFVVHLNHNQEVIMLVSGYEHPFIRSALSQVLEKPITLAIDKAVRAYSQKKWQKFDGRLLKIDYDGPVTIFDSNDRNKSLSSHKLRVSTDQGCFVWFIGGDGAIIRRKSVCSFGARLGAIYDHYWSTEPPVTKRTMLRNLTDIRGNLAGPYAKVIDNINLNWTEPDKYHLEFSPELDNSIFDRVMAYYHLDLIQRYFRDLGLEVLADYDHLNPLQIVLEQCKNTLYQTHQRKILLRKLRPADESDTTTENYQCTDARDARIIYHEFVHAVTDALARLHRQDADDQGNPRRINLLQAMAMDEGYADYFACSLAAQHGEAAGELGRLELKDDKLSWSPMPERSLIGPFDLKDIISTSSKKLSEQLKTNGVTIETLKYQWGTQWARYLWQLESNIGDRQLADTIVAHSIFFLTRWSGFEMAVLALDFADHLLFAQDSHHDKIIHNTPLAQATQIYWDEINDDMDVASGSMVVISQPEYETAA